LVRQRLLLLMSLKKIKFFLNLLEKQTWGDVLVSFARKSFDLCDWNMEQIFVSRALPRRELGVSSVSEYSALSVWN